MTPRLIAGFLATAALWAAAANSAGERWWRYVKELAGDQYEGRAAASEAHSRAAEYVAAEFRRLGLKPGAGESFVQKIPMNLRRIREADSSLTLARGGVQEWLQLGADAYFNLTPDAQPRVDAPAVFVGYGLTIPEAGYDDLAGFDLKGKIAVYLRGAPPQVPSALRAHYQSLVERWSFLRKAGAVGVAAILNPRAMDVPWERLSPLRLAPALSLAGPQFQETAGLRVSITVNPASADRFFTGTGHTLQEILELDRTGAPLPRFTLEQTVRAYQAIDRTDAVSENVLAVLPGRDTKLREEHIVLSAHLDHLGRGAPVEGDSIYNGALDNAAGVASLLEIARILKAAPPRRSVLFAAVTGEEHGLLGSKYLASSPAAPGRELVANLNLDMFQPLHRLRLLTVLGLEESSLGRAAPAAAKTFGVAVQGDPDPDRNPFIRSDQYSFIRAGIPSLAFRFGFEKGSAEEKIQRDWLARRYHAPSDDAEQPVDLAAAARFNRLVAAVAASAGNAPARPQWNESSFFRRFAR
jgi:Zn-dependent M28 family amino/carboxypeptidase